MAAQSETAPDAEKLDGLRKALLAAEERSATIEVESEKAVSTANTLNDREIPALQAKVDAAYLLLMSKRADLDAAIAARANGCDLVGTLVAAATIVAGVATGGAGLLAAAGAAEQFSKHWVNNSDSVKMLWKSKNLLGDDLKTVGAGLKTAAESVAAIQQAIAGLSPEQKKLPQFKMEREQFDQVGRCADGRKVHSGMSAEIASGIVRDAKLLLAGLPGTEHGSTKEAKVDPWLNSLFRSAG